jgi:GT2 family glycosyltransferase
MKKIIAITVNYNRSDSTKKLLESIDGSDRNDFELEIIVVDNAPVEPFRLSREYEVPVSIIRPGTNTGFAGGNNIGIKEAMRKGADYIMLINDDALMDPHAISNLKEVLESSEKIGVVSPKIYFAKGHEFHKNKYDKKELGRVIWFAGGMADWKHAKNIHRGLDEVDKGQFDTKGAIDFATGCCVMIKREVLETVGLFDERYFLYYEDDELSARIRNKGYDIYYVPEAVVYHENASSSGGAGNVLHDYFLTRNQMLFGMKYAPLRTKFALLRQSIRLLLTGREYQKRAIKDYYLRRFGKGTFFGK